MNYQDELLNDLQSGSELDDSGDVEMHGSVPLPENGSSNGDSNGHQNGDSSDFDAQLEAILSKPVSVQSQLHQMDIDVDDISGQLQLPQIIPQLKQRLGQFSDEDSDFLQLMAHSDYDNDEYKLLIKINQLTAVIHEEIDLVFRFVKFKYKIVFPELESIVPTPVDYARVVLTIKQDLINIKTFEPEFRKFLSSNKLLVLVMSGLSAVKSQFILNDHDLNVILDNARIILQLHELLDDVSSMIQTKLVKFVPNLNQLLGAITSSQLLISCGSLSALSTTPSCNLPSLGVRQLAGQNKLIKAPLQMGYLYYNEIIRLLPPEVQKPAMRVLSGKVILAARIDLSKSSPSGMIGAKYKAEVLDKINKLITPPEATPDKALPVPMDYKSKRRGGRRIRKMKQRFQMSDLRKAQNKMEFGKEEQTYTDNFGEEVGLGMMKSSTIQANTNTNASMSKAMRNRLNVKKETKNHLDSFLDDDYDQIIFNPQSQTVKDTTQSKWFTGMSNDEPAAKRQKK